MWMHRSHKERSHNLTYNSYNRDWTPQEGILPCISVAQPFATALVLGKKTIELRSWGTRYRGIMALHAGKRWYGERENGKRDAVEMALHTARRLHLPLPLATYPLGTIVGIVRLVRCTTFTPEGYEQLRSQHCSTASWTPNEYGWQFADVQALPAPVSYRGQLGLFGVEIALLGIEVSA